MNQLKQRQRMSNFVFLKMSDKMPPDRRGKLRNFHARFLHPAFAEQSLPRLNRFPHFLGRMRLRNCDKLDPSHVATRIRRHPCNLLAHTRQIFRNLSHAAL